MLCVTKSDTGAIWSSSKHQVFPQGSLRGSFCLGQVSRNALWQNSLSLPTFWYRWATFLILVTSFFLCDFHRAVTKTVLSTNTQSVYLFCFNAIRLYQQKGTSWHVRYVCYKTSFYRQLFHPFQNQNKQKYYLICIFNTEGKGFVISTKNYSAQNDRL